jgi:hypothetical protein
MESPAVDSVAPSSSRPHHVVAPRRPRARSPLLIVAAVVLLAAAGGGAVWTLQSRGGEVAEAPSSTVAAGTSAESRAPRPKPSSRSPSGSPDPTSSLTPTASPEERALQALGDLRQRSLQGLVLDGRWAAQVASKSVGITDPLQVAQNGTHTFYAVDILAESVAVREVAPPAAILVLQSTDFGKFSVARDGQPYWVTLVDLRFGSSDAVKEWCAAAFEHLNAEQLANACAPRTLTPSHS